MSFLTTLGQTVKNSVLCPLANANSALAQSAANALERAGVRSQQLTLVPNLLQAAACPVPQKPPDPQPPFNGGQCPVNYRVRIFCSREDLLLNGTWEPRNFVDEFQAVGPIRPLGEFRETRPTGSPCGNEVVDVQYRFLVGSQQSLITRVLRGEYNCGTFIGGVRNVQVGSISVERLDGQPDNCGDPDPIPPDPIPTGGLPPAPINFDFAPDINNPSVTVNVTGTAVVLPVFVNAKAEINVPVSLSLNVDNQGDLLEVNANVNLSTGDVTINVGGNGGNRTPGQDDCEPDYTEPTEDPPPSPVDTGKTEQPRPDEGEEVIIGALVTVTSISPNARPTLLGQDDNPDIYVPSLGHINFLCRAGAGAVGGWLPDQQVKNRRCLIPCDWPYGAVDVKGTPQPGVTWQITPIRDRRRTPTDVLLQ